MQTLLNGVIEKAVEGLEGHAGGEKGDDTQMMVVGACAYAGLGTGEDAIRRASDLMCKVRTFCLITQAVTNKSRSKLTRSTTLMMT